jgi:phosphatidylserine/phosphatidylglycerophosphate/cardiolipin synthase-like enzyme
MHNKFILIDAPRGKQILFGSMNLSKRSLYANHELLVVSSNPPLIAAFTERWTQMVRELQEMGA